MHIGHVFGAALGPLLVIVGLVIIGSVFSRRAGAASARMWMGLGLLALLQLLSIVWTYALPSFAYRGMMSLGALSVAYGLISAVVFLAAIAVLASAVVVGRGPQHAGYLDPSRPGAPPTAYQGVGYPPVAGQSPYESRTPDTPDR